MTDSMVERVARALWPGKFEVWDANPDAPDSVAGRAAYFSWAREGIEALRELPSGLENIVYHGEYGDAVWRDTIDAILSEQVPK